MPHGIGARQLKAQQLSAHPPCPSPFPCRLEDLKQLGAYGLQAGSVLAHVPSYIAGGGGARTPATEGTGVDYAAVARLLESAHAAALQGRPDPVDYSFDPGASDWEGAWTGGDAWRGYPLVMGRGGEPPLRRDEVVTAGSSDDELEGGGSDVSGGAGPYNAAFLASADDATLEAVERQLEAADAAGDAGTVATAATEGGEVDSNRSQPRSRVSERKVLPSSTAHAPAPAAANGGGAPADTPDRIAARATLRRVRDERRSRRAIVTRHAHEEVVPFAGGGADGGGIRFG